MTAIDIAALLDVAEAADWARLELDVALGYVREANHHSTAASCIGALWKVNAALANLARAGGAS
jgi:hypothetical protein